MNNSQVQALSQIREIEAASTGAVSIVTEPVEIKAAFLRIDLSLDTSSLEQVAAGLTLRSRERFYILVPKDFPFAKPEVWTYHNRFAGHAHVQWSRYLCLYQAPDVEWEPSDGMFGFMDRLWKWFKQAALNELDPFGGAIHPPTTASGGSSYVVIPRVDTPHVGVSPWTGFARLREVGEQRVDIVDWTDVYSGEEFRSSAAAVLLSEPMPWEFPQKAADLVQLLIKRGVPKEYLLLILSAAAHKNEEGNPLYLLVGTPMRGVRGSGDLRQHLTAWRIEPTFAEGLRLIANKYSDDEGLRKIGEQVEQILFDWAETADISWCRVLEDRPEIVTRRDHRSPMSLFRGKSVVVWGCGALGGHVAIHLARAGAERIVLRDNALVTPGVLVRQPYNDADVGQYKAKALAEKLRTIRATDPSFKVVPIVSNVLSTVLDSDDWTDNADVVFDCTASRGVRLKLEKIRKEASPALADIVSMIVSREATHGLTVVAAADHTGGPADVYRRAKIDICRDRSLRHVANAFYPLTSEEDLFQPEPGCSSPTFIGSSADAAALSALLLNSAACDLARVANEQTDAHPTAWAHVAIQPHSLAVRKRASANFEYRPDIVTDDPRRGYEVRTSHRAWGQIERWVARSRDDAGPEIETGGLSFGERNDAIGVIWVTEVDGPPPDSVARPDHFECGTVGTQQAHLTREEWSRGSVRYVGMWHTHPESAPVPSTTDLRAMGKILSDGFVNPSKSLLSILGTPNTDPLLGTFVFDRDDVREYRGETYRRVRIANAGERIAAPRRPNLGLALSGGGSRAIAFHLGCLRALNDRGILDQVGVLSAVSGGAVLAAMYAYSDDDFTSFESRVRALLYRGLQLDIALTSLNPFQVARTLMTSLTAGVAAKGAQVTRQVLAIGHDLLNRGNRSSAPDYLAQIAPPFLRWASRTTAFESVLRDLLFGDVLIRHPHRTGLDVVLNATELRTGTAFRFGSRTSACSRLGTIQEEVPVATAVAASAAYPAFLPALHKKYTFEKRGETTTNRVVLTDGGVYDNLGVSCLNPNRDPKYTDHFYPCDHLICCSAGQGQWDGSGIPYGWASRMSRTVEATFRKAQDRTVGGLFGQLEAGNLERFVLPYLGMKDESLKRDSRVGPLPEDFVYRNDVIGYPTDFRSMSDDDFNRLSRRGEQLTRLLLNTYWPV